MRRAFRVAAVFAGAAAGAAAFAPAAGAATAVPDRPADIVFNNCTTGESHFVHLYFPPSKEHGPQCAGYNGYRYFGGTEYSRFCAGNNYGWINIVGTYFSFSPGYRAAGNLPVESLSITGHTGSDTCPGS